ncbi:hypothetical protein ACC699_39760, partial [Rhizobium ruizarguesonis]
SGGCVASLISDLIVMTGVRSRLADFSLMSRDGRQVPLDKIGHSEIRFEEPILKRRDRTPVITIRSDINEATQPPEVSQQV